MALSPIARAIAEVEGYFKPGTVAHRLNNPGNLVYARQAGATPVPITSGGITRTFASWPTAQQGEAALERDLALKAGRGLTVEQTIQTWLGNTTVKNAEGDPVLYTHLVTSRLGISPSTPLAQLVSPITPKKDSGLLPATAAEIEARFDEWYQENPRNQTILYAGLGLAAAVIVSAIVSD